MLMTNANANRLLFLILWGHRNNLTSEVFLSNLILLWHSTAKAIQPLGPIYVYSTSLSVSISPSSALSILSLVRECPHCVLAAGGATILSAISSEVLIWPLMGLDELGASLYRERERNPQDWKSW